MPLSILFADDENSLQELMRCELPIMGHKAAVCPDGVTAIAALEKAAANKTPFDCLLVDLDMPGASGLDVIEAAKKLTPEADAIILTGKGTLETAIAALRYGVFDYLTKPCKLAEIEEVLNRIEKKRDLKNKLISVQTQLTQTEVPRYLVGDSAPMLKVQKLIDRIAPTDSTVVILGETGTGKELVARAVHEKSRRCQKPFVAVNCGALPENLIESELFGHKKGSFTGADENRTGLLQVANGGTLFLDEIGEMPKAIQAKFLRFLESGEIRKVGENAPVTCDVRVVCATLQNLEAMVSRGDFREDLWFRINTFEIFIPPLRDRLDDLPALILHLAKRNKNGNASTNFTSINELFTDEAVSLLMRYSWPGNVRQLANTIEHAFVLADSVPIGPDSLPVQIRNCNVTPVASSKTKHDDTDFSDATSNHADFSHAAFGNAAFTEETGNHNERMLMRRPDRPIKKTAEPVTPRAVSNHPAASQGPLADLLAFNPGIQTPEAVRFHEPESSSDTGTKTLRDLEIDAIQTALERASGNKAKAAEELGISLKTLYNKLNQTQDVKKTA